MKNLLFVLLALLTFPLFAQRESVVSPKGTSRIEVTAGVIILPEGAGTAPMVSGSYLIDLNCRRDNPNRPLWCTLLELEVAWVGPFKDPWQDIPPVIVIPPRPQPDPTPWEDFQLSELEIGSGVLVTPSIGLEIGLSDRFSLTGFAGGGFQYTQANTTQMGDLGTFRTMDATHPVLSYGATARIGLSNRVAAKLEFQGLTAFGGSMDVVGPDGSIATFEGMSMFTPSLNAGISIQI